MENSFVKTDIFSLMLEDRILFLSGEVNEISANDIITKLLYLESKDRDNDICLYINQSGRIGIRRVGDLRHDEVYKMRRIDHMYRDGVQHGRIFTEFRYERKKVCAA